MEKKIWTLDSVREFTSHMSASLFGQKLFISTDEDKRYEDPNKGRRIYIRIYYHAPCSKSGQMEKWEGRKWYISPFSTKMEIAMTVKVALMMAVEHEVLEGFKYDDIIIVNPHVSFEKLLEISPHEEVRKEIFDF